ncbi:MAG: 3-deoxy-D-manno-octulosonic acid transferase [Acidobacteriota bacterium]|nr:3-deoxy-D-manno-octulosonic acid transferase [Acidobacteriota bacterium]
MKQPSPSPVDSQRGPLRKALGAGAWGLYQLAFGASLVLTAPWILIRRGGHYRDTVLPRLGRVPEAPRDHNLWLHAVSVGEVGVAATLVAALPEKLPLVVTTITPTGQQRARSSLGGRATVTYFPFELGFAIRRFFHRLRPAALVLVEGDLWPLVLRTAQHRRLPVTVVNGRVSDRSFRRMERLRKLLGPLFRGVQRFGVQTAEDRRRLVQLGVAKERVTVTGNLKYETPEPPTMPKLEALVRALAGERRVLLAGSTMAGEEEQVLDAFQHLGAERALLVLAPRHPERWDEVFRLLRQRGVEAARRSALNDDSAEPGAPAVLLLDSLGELAALYRIADAAFIGGTLVPTGGHNPLEPARFGIATAVGPSMENFREMAQHFDAAHAWERVADARALGETWDRWLSQPQLAADVGGRARDLVAANRGAVAKTLELLRPMLEQAGFDAGGAEEETP